MKTPLIRSYIATVSEKERLVCHTPPQSWYVQGKHVLRQDGWRSRRRKKKKKKKKEVPDWRPCIAWVTKASSVVHVAKYSI